MKTEESTNNVEIPHPPIASREEWLSLRKELLKQEKAATREVDRVNALRRRLPMVKLEKDYVLNGPDGPVPLKDIFEGRHQLFIYHFMFDPKWDEGCVGCTGFVNELGDLSLLWDRNTTFALISRAPIEKLIEYKEKFGWTVPWYSSSESDFNYDFNITHSPSVSVLEFQYPSDKEVDERKANADGKNFEDHGASVFFRIGDDVYHCYSTHARGVETLTSTYRMLDSTPYGRQEDWEDSPAGFPQKPTYG